MLRSALAQVSARVGDLEGDAELIIEWTRRSAGRGARVVVSPEMMLTGYRVEDLALRASFVEASIAALHGVAERLAASGLGGVPVVAGYLDRRADLAPRTGLPIGAPQDAAALLYGGRVVITSAKHHLPNYGRFDEVRYFVPGDTLPGCRRTAVSRSTSRLRSARTCGRTAARWRPAGAPGRPCWWCRTRRPTSAARTTCGLTCASGGRARPGPRWRTPT